MNLTSQVAHSTDAPTPFRDPRQPSDERRLLVLDTSYTLEMIRANKLEASVTCRSLRGFFSQVWTVHPYASLLTSPDWAPQFGPPNTTRLDENHIFIEGKVGRFNKLRRLPFLNFIVAQIDLLRRLAKLIRDERISAIRAGDPLLNGLYGYWLARQCGIPLVVRVSGDLERLREQIGGPIMPRFFRSRRVERFVERFVLSRADLVAAPNVDNLRYAASAGAKPGSLTVFRYGNLVAPVHFTDPASRSSGVPLIDALGRQSSKLILCVSRLERVKMPEHAISVLRIVRDAGINASLVLVGGGKMRTELEALSAELQVTPYVFLAGERDQDWLARVIPHADLVLSPLTGRALSETSLGGAPTVAYDLDWQGELIRSGETGELVPAGDISAMARAAISLLNDRESARRMGNALRAAALEMMDPQRLDEHERSEYTKLLARAGSTIPPNSPG